MSDFLTNLALRSMGLAETIRPRLPFRYEPCRPGGGLLAPTGFIRRENKRELQDENDLEIDRGAMSPENRITRLEGRTALSSVGKIGPIQFTERATMADKPKAQSPWDALQGPTSSRESLSAEPLATSQLLDDRGFPATNAGHRRVESEPAVGSPTGHEATRKPTRRRNASPSGIAGDHIEANLKSTDSEDWASPGITVHRSATRVANGARAAQVRLPTSNARIRQPSTENATPSPARLQPLPPPQPTAPEPAIQVTIGRIEVRAIPQPAVRPKVRSGRPAVSLDEYLQRRVKRAGE